jgi:hypothetical protein
MQFVRVAVCTHFISHVVGHSNATIVTISTDKFALLIGKRGDLRDMLAMCRNLNLRPEKVCRKDLKKIEILLEELHFLTQRW